MWKVPFSTYVTFNGVKEAIEGTKRIKKDSLKAGKLQYGMQIEETITKVLADTGLEVKHTTPQMDIGFGADALVSYKDDNKNYSFYVDITGAQKSTVQYLSLTGTTTTNIEEAFSYNTEYGNFYFGLKEKNNNWFFYEKPVVVLYIQGFIPCTGMAVSHITNIRNILISLNGMLVDKGYGARASTLVRPNLNKFRYN